MVDQLIAKLRGPAAKLYIALFVAISTQEKTTTAFPERYQELQERLCKGVPGHAVRPLLALGSSHPKEEPEKAGPACRDLAAGG